MAQMSGGMNAQQLYQMSAAQKQQQMQQHHRIHTAGQRAEHALSARASRNLLPHFFVSSRSN